MSNRFSNLKCKEVVNVCDGCRLGYVADVTVDLKCGRILALIVPGPCRFCGILGRHEVFRDNLRARAFYEAKGFALKGIAKPAFDTEEVLYSKGL